jgi:hypothetical protein
MVDLAELNFLDLCLLSAAEISEKILFSTMNCY